MTPEEVRQSGIDLWFTTQLGQIHRIGKGIETTSLSECDTESFREAKEAGFSDRQLADLWECEPSRFKRRDLGIRTVFRLVDTRRNSRLYTILLFFLRGKRTNSSNPIPRRS